MMKERKYTGFKQQMHEYFQRKWKEQKQDPEYFKRWLQRTVPYDRNMMIGADVDIEWLWNEILLGGRNQDQKKLNLEILVANLLKLLHQLY